MEFRRSWKVLIGSVVGALFLVATVAFAAAPDKVDLSKYKGTKAAVSFDHKKHADPKVAPCATCHHKAKDAKKEAACGDCHKKDAEGTTLSFKDAFHKSCKDCHTKAGKGPTKCGECHK
jgi:cytochrome c553